MKVVQTFWSGRNNPLEKGYGWLGPVFNIMSWTLSCISLREHYDEVVLYTDSAGYAVFHDILKLPYTQYEVLYDHIECKANHWAYPKLLTYALQEKPFIHVDGDVFLRNRLSPVTESGELIAQNLEIGTLYYKGMMNAIMKSPVNIPDILYKEIIKDSIPSYNAGVIGGNDIEFIKEYCLTAFEFIAENRLNAPENEYSNVNLNILFEQILFYALAVKYDKKVATVIDHPVIDNGYTYDEFCNFKTPGKNNLMHIIGGYKRNPKICRMLGIILHEKFPEVFGRIQQLFPQHKLVIK
ncbi:MAG: hypothetical protein LBQ60_12000 [Bacteroidales bacterium]|jgi:hypothetical protein|nr:hypothetical protein [Bacteroidales bacterium]